MLHRWDARCRFLGLVLATFGLLHMNETALVLFSLLLVGIAASCRLPVKAMAQDLKAWAIFLLFIFLVQPPWSNASVVELDPVRIGSSYSVRSAPGSLGALRTLKEFLLLHQPPR